MSRIALVVLLALASVGFGQSTVTVWQPPRVVIPVPVATISNEMLTNLKIGKESVILEETRLSDAQKWTGGAIGSRGDAGEALQWLCFVGSDADGRWALWLESSEMGGGTIDGFLWQRISSDALIDSRCITKSIQVDLPVKLSLRSTESEVREILGAPTDTYHSALIYSHDHAQRVRGEAYTSSTTIYIGLRRDLVWSIQVWKTTSN